MSRSLVINSQIVIPDAELAVSFVRSSGPGGQNVNKVNSKAVLRWDFRNSRSLPQDVKLRFESYFPTRINQSGEVQISSDRYRDQGRNLADCREKLRQLVQAASVTPQKRRPTRPTRRSIEKRLAGKRHKSQIKHERGFRTGDI